MIAAGLGREHAHQPEQLVSHHGVTHYLVRVMWALLKRGTDWQENPAPAKAPGSASGGGPAAERGEGASETTGGERMSESA